MATCGVVSVVGVNHVTSDGRLNDGHVAHIRGDAAESNLVDGNAVPALVRVPAPA